MHHEWQNISVMWPIHSPQIASDMPDVPAVRMRLRRGTPTATAATPATHKVTHCAATSRGA